MTDYRESEEIQTEAIKTDEENVEPVEDVDERPLVARWMAWVDIIDR